MPLIGCSEALGSDFTRPGGVGRRPFCSTFPQPGLAWGEVGRAPLAGSLGRERSCLRALGWRRRFTRVAGAASGTGLQNGPGVGASRVDGFGRALHQGVQGATPAPPRGGCQALGTASPLHVPRGTPRGSAALRPLHPRTDSPSEQVQLRLLICTGALDARFGGFAERPDLLKDTLVGQALRVEGGPEGLPMGSALLRRTGARTRRDVRLPRALSARWSVPLPGRPRPRSRPDLPSAGPTRPLIFGELTRGASTVPRGTPPPGEPIRASAPPRGSDPFLDAPHEPPTGGEREIPGPTSFVPFGSCRRSRGGPGGIWIRSRWHWCRRSGRVHSRPLAGGPAGEQGVNLLDGLGPHSALGGS